MLVNAGKFAGGRFGGGRFATGKFGQRAGEIYVILVDGSGNALVDNEGRAVVIPLAMAERIAA